MISNSSGLLPHPLLSAILAGNPPKSATLDDIAAMLSASPGGLPDPTKSTRAMALLSLYVDSGLIKLIDSGETKSDTRFSLMLGSFKLTDQEGELTRRQRERRRRFEEHATGAPVGRPLTPTLSVARVNTTPIKHITAAELLKVAHLLRAEDLWPTRADSWCGVSPELSVVAQDQSESTSSDVVHINGLKKRAKPHCTNINSIIKNRKANSYKHLFEPDPDRCDFEKFKAHAISRGDWDDSGMSLTEVTGKWGHRIK